MDFIDINLFEAILGTDDHDRTIVVSDDINLPWYADMFTETGSFYQMRARMIQAYPSSQQKKADLALRFSRVDIEERSEIMSDSPFAGKWWEEDVIIRTLVPYQRNSYQIRQMMTDFHDKICERLRHKYKFVAMRLHPDYYNEVKDLVQDKFRINIEEEATYDSGC